MVRSRKNVKAASAPYVWLAPSPEDDRDRLVTMAPMLLCRRMSRLTRTTAKLVAGAPMVSSARCWMSRRPSIGRSGLAQLPAGWGTLI
jgi:hypothetical protein